MSLGQRIKDQRNNKNLTQAALANSLELSLDMIKKLETNRVNPSIESLIKISNLLDCSIDYLLKGSESLDYHGTPYSRMLKLAIEKSGFSLAEISDKLKPYSVKTNKSYISKLQNGIHDPAGDEINIALSTVLDMDELTFRTLAYIDKIPPEVIAKIVELQEDTNGTSIT